jgi:hypothetical protein
MQKAREEQRIFFFLIALFGCVAVWVGVEFVGEGNVPETASRSGCVHGPVGRKLDGPNLSPELDNVLFVWENSFFATASEHKPPKFQITTRIVDLPRITAGELGRQARFQIHLSPEPKEGFHFVSEDEHGFLLSDPAKELRFQIEIIMQIDKPRTRITEGVVIYSIADLGLYRATS